MPCDTLPSFLDSLRASGLLPEDQLAEATFQAECLGDDLIGFKAFLQERGWLNNYQVAQIEAGAGRDLRWASYRLVEFLGETRSGPVYRGIQAGSTDSVVLKGIRPSWLAADITLAGFLERMQTVRELQHPHLVNVLDASDVEARLFVVFEHYEGADLGWLVRQGGALPGEQAIAFIRQAGEALQTAHERGIFHGELTPSSLLITPIEQRIGNGTPDARFYPAANAIVRVLDLGVMPPRSLHSDTALQLPISTLEYLAPERLLNLTPADTRSEVRSLALVLAYALSGRPPFGTTSVQAAIDAVKSRTPTVLEQLPRELPSGLIRLIHNACATDPQARPENLGSFLAELETSFATARLSPMELPMADEIIDEAEIPEAMRVANTSGDGDNPFASMEAEDLFSSGEFDHGGMAPASTPQVASKGNRMLWIILGSMLHLTAVVVIILFLLGYFDRTSNSKKSSSKPVSPAVRK